MAEDQVVICNEVQEPNIKLVSIVTLRYSCDIERPEKEHSVKGYITTTPRNDISNT